MSSEKMSPETLQTLVPLFQTVLWILLASVLLKLLWKYVDPLLRSILKRIERGSPLSVGGLTLGAPPASLPAEQPGAATAEGAAGTVPPNQVQSILEKKQYPASINDRFYLVHAAETIVPRTTPGSGRYRVRLWVETEPPGAIGEVESVTYRLYDDFSPSVISTTARDKSFELWLNAYGEFNVVAVACRRSSAESVWLTRYLDLPGRPPD